MRQKFDMRIDYRINELVYLKIDSSRLSELPLELRKHAETKIPVLQKCIGYIEKDLDCEYPSIRLHPYLCCYRTEGGGLSFGWAITNAFQVQKQPPAAEYFIVVYVPTILYFGEDCIVGILTEEFLHYVFNATKHMKREHIPTGLAHEKAMHSPDLWFKSSYIKKCFHKVQKKLELKKSLEILRDWKNKGGQLTDGSDLPRLRGIINTVLISPHIAKTIMEKRPLEK